MSENILEFVSLFPDQLVRTMKKFPADSGDLRREKSKPQREQRFRKEHKDFSALFCEICGNQLVIKNLN